MSSLGIWGESLSTFHISPLHVRLHPMAKLDPIACGVDGTTTGEVIVPGDMN